MMMVMERVVLNAMTDLLAIHLLPYTPLIQK
jgi:hypothetical protein